MSRDGSGNMNLAPGNPVVSGTTITASQFNTTIADLAVAIGGSLPRDGQAGMTGPFRLADGTASIPAFGFNSEASTGLFRPGTATLAFTAGGTERMRLMNGNLVVGSTSDGGEKFQVTGTAKFTGNTTVGGVLGVTGAITVGGMLGVAGNTTVSGTLGVTGAITGSLTGAVTGNASTATVLQTARTVNGVSFDGSSNIVITGNTPSTLTRGAYLTGTDFNGSAATTWGVDGTPGNIGSKVVVRDASGNFSAGTITATLAGNASTATSATSASSATTAGSCSGNAATASTAYSTYTANNFQMNALGVGTSNTTSGTIYATSNITAYSDIRLKTDIQVITSALSKISAVRGVTYVRTDLEDKSRHTGVIAQELQAVLPEAVITTDDGTLSVAYGNVVGLLIEAIKELHAKVAVLETM